MKRTLVLLAFASGVAIAETRYTGAEIAGDGRSLLLRTLSGTEPAPALPEQVAFSAPRVSLDGRYAGWLALFPNCCTSYPIPLVLVVIGPGRSLHRFEGSQATFAWCFAASGREVVYRRSALHGPGPEYFERRRIEDGVLLSSHEQATVKSTEPESELPQWASCAAE